MDLADVFKHISVLYQAARLASLTGDQHELIKNSAKELQVFLDSLKDKTKEESEKQDNNDA